MQLTEELKARIRAFASESPESIALKAMQYPDLPIAFIAQQVKARQRIQKKLPTWQANEDIVFPDSLALEQCSSESVAKHKASLLAGESLADLTGGFGVDAFAFSESFDRVYHIERDRELSSIVAQNARTLGKDEVIRVISGDGLEWLEGREETFDVVYVDPARRDARSFKVSALSDCEPDVAKAWEFLLSKGKRVALKLSPGLDVDSILKELPGIREIHILSVRNECKECFCIAESGYAKEVLIVCSEQDKSGAWTRFSFLRSGEKALDGDYSALGRYLYEPNASIMKGGGFKTFGKEQGLKLIHKRTRFYTSDDRISGFPGRVFEVLERGELRSKSARRLFPECRANVLARNAGMSSDALKRKLRLADGGDLFAIGTTDISESRVLLKCRRAD